MFYNLFGRFLVKNVEAILGDLSNTVERLERAVAAHQKLGDHHENKADKHAYLAETAYDEAARAKRVVSKFRALLG
jgi:hypothetical protein